MNQSLFDDELHLAGLLRQPQLMFILWALRTEFCRSVNDFHYHFGKDLPAVDLVGLLELEGLIRKHGNELVLTDIGNAVISELAHEAAVETHAEETPPETHSEVLLVTVLKRIRMQHGKSQDTIAECMGISRDTYRHIEKGRRPIPDFRHGLIDWIRRFLSCAEATEQEQKGVLSLVSQEFVYQFADRLQDIEKQGLDRQGGKSPDK